MMPIPADSLPVHGLHAVHAVHGKSGENHGKPNPGLADPKDLQTNPAHIADPTVYSCGMRGMRAAMGRVLHKESAVQERRRCCQSIILLFRC